MNFPRSPTAGHLFEWPEKRIFLEFERYKNRIETPSENTLRFLEKQGYIAEEIGVLDLIVDGVKTSYEWTSLGRRRLAKLINSV